MQFLTPFALALGLLAVPIAVLYMLRLRRRDTPFPSTLLWAQVVRDRDANAPWQRLRRNWLLILQLLILLTLILALARPFIAVPTLAAGRVALLLDASASMNATDVQPTRFEAARRAALAQIDTLSANSAVAIIRVGAQPQALTAYTSDKVQLRAAIAAAQPGTTSGDWAAALSLAAAGASGADTFTVLIISDGGLPPVTALPPVPGTVRYIPIGQSAENVAIGALSVAATPGNPPELYARLINEGTQDAPVVFSVTLDGQLFSAQTITLPAGSAHDVVIDQLPAIFSRVRAQITRSASSTTPDFLAEDDSAYAVYTPAQAGRALLMTDQNRFLQQGFTSLPGWAIYTAPANSPLPVEPFDLYVFDGWLPATLPAANLLIINPPATVSNALLKVTAAVAPATQGGSIIANDPQTGLVLDGLSFSAVHVRSHATIVASWAKTLISAPDGSALLQAGEYNGHHVALIPFDLHDSDLPLTITWPILLSDLSNWYQTPPALRQQNGIAPGQPIAIRPLPGADRVTVQRPDGTIDSLAVGQGTSAYAQTMQPGFYQVTIYKGTHSVQQATFAVNLFDPLQSHIAPVQALSVQSSTPTQTVAAVGQQEYWPLLATLALSLLTLEWVIYQRRRPSTVRSPALIDRRKAAR